MLVQAGEFVQGGRTVGRLDDGRVVFLDGLFPGEVAQIRITEEKKDYCATLRSTTAPLCLWRL